MKQGFFASSELTVIKEPISLIPKCGTCGLYKTCKSPKMKPTGKGRRKVLIVAEAPGKDEDRQGIQLVGKSGLHLEKTLRKFDFEMRKDAILTNALICRPPHNEIDDKRMIDYCRPNLVNTINEVQPEIIIPLGGIAVQSLIGSYLWRDDVGKIGRWVGWRIPCQKLNAWVCPTYHPSYIIRSKGDDARVLQRRFEDHLEKAISLEGRPYETVPDYREQVKIEFDPKKAAQHIMVMAAFGRPLAFDYETNMLKPDNEDGYIVCCSFSDGLTSIAFPWQGEVVEATKRILEAPKIPKRGYNIKFEERWTRAKLGCRVRNWQFCGMVGSHTIDNRPEINSLKFQAFVRLGQESYDDNVREYLKPRGGGNVKNRIKEVDITTLLGYCGLDSLLEWIVAEQMMKELGYARS